MGKFKITCMNCGSDKVVEMSNRKKIDWSAGRIKYGIGIQRKCTDCANEDFTILNTKIT